MAITGLDYEHLCAKRLKRCGFTRVTVTKGSGDQGIDVIAYKKGVRYGIQCKYYSKPVGNSAVQEAYAGARHYDCDFAAVMTNSTFTKSAKELAGSTGVLLWERDYIPFSASSHISRITKWMGILVVALFAFALFMSNVTVKDYKHPVWQNSFFVVAILGGLCNIFESGYFVADVLACVFYLVATVLSVIISLVFKHPIDSGDFYMLIPFFVSFLRGAWLFFLNQDNRKTKTERHKEENTSPLQVNKSDDSQEPLQTEYDDLLQKMGNTYVNLFNENCFTKCHLVKADPISNGTYEFFIECETEDQARYLLSKERVLNNDAVFHHKITLLCNNIISLVLTKLPQINFTQPNVTYINNAPTKNIDAEWEQLHDFMVLCNAELAKRDKTEGN